MSTAGTRVGTFRVEQVEQVVTYNVKHIFFTLQGEGARAGRAAVFCRFSGCNLWSGLEKDRAGARCTFCDTDFLGTDGDSGGKYPDEDSLAAAVAARWTPSSGPRYVVCTGGEPLLQVDEALTCALHRHGFEVALETNGTLQVPPGVDWICVSPKQGTRLMVTEGDELKVVYPQPAQDMDYLASLNFQHQFRGGPQ